MKKIVLMTLMSVVVIKAWANCTPVWTNNFMLEASASPCAVEGSQRFFNLSEDKTLTIGHGASLVVNGDLDVWDRVVVYGSLTVNGTISVAADASLVITLSGCVTAENLQNGGLFPGQTIVEGKLSVSNRIANRVTGTISGNGLINGNIVNDGLATFGGKLQGSCAGKCVGALAAYAVAFVGDAATGACRLQWSAADATAAVGFYIEKMTLESKSFENVGFVPVSGSASGTAQSYSFTDQNFSGDTYYRLKLARENGIGDFGQAIFISKLAKGHATNTEIHGRTTDGVGSNRDQK